MHHRFAYWATTMLLLAPTLASSADQERFDLHCVFKEERIIRGDQSAAAIALWGPSSGEGTYRIDLKAAKNCFGPCGSIEDIKALPSGETVLSIVQSGSSASDAYARMTVLDAATNTVAINQLGMYLEKPVATKQLFACSRRQFSGFP